jgi:dihydrofolate reductase
MRKVKLQLQTSLDGYIADQDGGMGWITWTYDSGCEDYANNLIDTSDTIVMGRKLAEGFIPYWTEITTKPDDPQYPFARKMVDTQKVVFSKTGNQSARINTTIATGELADEISQLKNRQGKDIIVYGGGSLVSSLIQEGLIDEYHLLVNPAILGKGLPIYQMLDHTVKLKLIKALPLNSGIVILSYQSAG